MLAFWIGYLADLIFGDPYWMPHPIRLIGKLIEWTENAVRKIARKDTSLKIGGVVLLLIVVSVSFAVPFVILKIANSVSVYLALAIEAFMVYQILATKCLDVETAKVRKKLEKHDLNGARHAISMLVSRDTEKMEREDIIKAAVETMTENIVDGIISPMFYIAIGGAPLGFAFKAVNTLDSMVGYKNEKYLHLGWASAKFDDLANYVPARITAVLVIIAAFILKLDYKNAIKILVRDKKNHSSPNSPLSEAPAAGALRIELGGKAWYFGEMSLKPTMGDPLETPEVIHIKKSSYLMYMTSFIGILLVTVCVYMIR